MKWIDANLEKPDADAIVLVAVRDSSEPVWLGYFDDSESDDTWRDVEGGRIDVSHWMERPKAPENSEVTS